VLSLPPYLKALEFTKKKKLAILTPKEFLEII